MWGCMALRACLERRVLLYYSNGCLPPRKRNMPAIQPVASVGWKFGGIQTVSRSATQQPKSHESGGHSTGSCCCCCGRQCWWDRDQSLTLFSPFWGTPHLLTATTRDRRITQLVAPKDTCQTPLTLIWTKRMLSCCSVAVEVLIDSMCVRWARNE